ncbi:RNase H family protein [Arthrobacter rhombi]|uniref:RNase H family protein n=1 Tax=Arthrobacter rhombi TaxID=71253 RepID=UPI003FD1003E
MTITAAADGSALGNPGPAGWAWYVDDSAWRAGGWPHGTNNMGELMAVLDLFRSTEHVAEEHLHILCDSQYVINCITKWMPGWKRKGWKKADGKPVLNVDLLKQIDDVITGRDYSFEWVKGHAGHYLNEAADDRARAAATAYQTGRGSDTGPGYPGSGQPATDSEAAASITVAEPAPAPAERPEQDDLFSSLEDPSETGRGSAEIDAVVALERELLDPRVRSEVGQLNFLLHPDYREVTAQGTVNERDTAVTVLSSGATDLQESTEQEGEDDDVVQQVGLSASAAAPGSERAVELLEAIRLGGEAIHLTYRLVGTESALAVGSLWQREEQRWRLRFRQETPEL